MPTFSRVNLLLVSCALVLCVYRFWQSENDLMTPVKGNRNSAFVTNSVEHCLCGEDELVLLRNNISRFLNRQQQLSGQIKCQSISKSNTSGKHTSETGGWCPIATKTKHFGFDGMLVKTLAEIFKGKSVGSFGDGPGRYKRAILATGLVKMYDAYDGAPFCESTSNGMVSFLDLSIPQHGLPVYDWILSLEVAEHIPQHYEAIFLSNVIRHAREGVVLSWALPGQNGYSHVNNREPEYVIESVKKLGFEIDVSRTYIIRNGTKLPWLRRNVNVFTRKEEKSYCDLACDA